MSEPSPTITITVDDPEALKVIRRRAKRVANPFLSRASPFTTKIQIQSDGQKEQSDGASIPDTEDLISSLIWREARKASGSRHVKFPKSS